MAEGVFLTDRGIFNNRIWQNILKFRLFFFIYGNAVFLDEGVYVGEVHVKRGQLLRSYRNLQSDLEYMENNAIKRYSLSMIKKAVDELVEEGRIKTEETKHGTLFTVINYEQYQGFDRFDKQSIEQRKNRERTEKEQGTNNNKNDNNDKNVKNENKYIGISSQLQSAIEDFKEYRKKIKKPMTDRAVELLIDKLNKLASDDETKIAILNQSIVNGWQGVFSLKQEQTSKSQPQQYKSAAELREERYKKAQEEAMRILREQGVITDDGEGSENDY